MNMDTDCTDSRGCGCDRCNALYLSYLEDDDDGGDEDDDDRKGSTMIETYKTLWIGIRVQQEDGHYWIMDDDGGEDYVGTNYPNDARLAAYRDAVIRW